MCRCFRRSDGVPKRRTKRYSQDWARSLSIQRRLLLEISTRGPVPSLTTWPAKTYLQSSCVNLGIPECVVQGPPYNMSTSALLVNYHRIYSICLSFPDIQKHYRQAVVQVVLSIINFYGFLIIFHFFPDIELTSLH